MPCCLAVIVGQGKSVVLDLPSPTDKAACHQSAAGGKASV